MRHWKKQGQRILLCAAPKPTYAFCSQSRALSKKATVVYLAEDAIYTSTTLNTPALKRMQLAGANIVETAEVIRAIENSDKPAIENKFKKMNDIPDIDVNKVAVVIVNYDDESLENVSDTKKEQKKERIKYLNHYAEVLEIPVFYLYDGRVEQVKKDMHLPLQVQFLKADNSYQKLTLELAALQE